jgi:hypothetical protein
VRRPRLAARIKQVHSPARKWVHGVHSVCLGRVARGARPSEVLKGGHPAGRFGDAVVAIECGITGVIGVAAVLAAPSRPSADRGPEPRGYFGNRHPQRCRTLAGRQLPEP